MSLANRLSPRSLTRRLSLYYALAFFSFLGVSFFILYLTIGALIDSRMDEDLEDDIEEFRDYLALTGPQGLTSEMDKEAAGEEAETMFMQLYNRDSVLVHTTDLGAWQGLKPYLQRIENQFELLDEVSLQTISLTSQESDARVVIGSLSRDYTLIIGESNHERDDIMELLAVAFTMVFLLAIPLASIVVLQVTRRAISGIHAVSLAASDIKSGNLDRRVRARHQVVEVQTLADTFDAMADRIQGLIRNMREMTDNIAHDLRSPLGRVRLLSESIVTSSTSDPTSKKTANETIAECDRLINMINLSLDVAETEAGVSGHQRTRLDLTTMVEDACELFEAAAEQNEIELNRNLSPGCAIDGDLNSLQRMIANIIDNAVKFTDPAGTIDVSLVSIGDSIQLTVRDSGIGIKESNYDAVFDRFFRVDPGRTEGGCGLGLSYSRAVARAHGGDIKIESELGKYTAFIITLPLTSPQTLINPLEPSTADANFSTV